MLLQYNLNNPKIGQTNVNVIYSKNHTLSKVTIINGTRFRINYPYNITNNLSSNVMVVQKVKFADQMKNNSPQKLFENPKLLFSLLFTKSFELFWRLEGPLLA